MPSTSGGPSTGSSPSSTGSQAASSASPSSVSPSASSASAVSSVARNSSPGASPPVTSFTRPAVSDHRPQRAVDHVRDRRLEQERAGAHAVEALDPLGLAHERLAGAHRVAEPDLRARRHRAQVGLQQRVGGEPRALVGELDRARELARDGGGARRLEQRARPRVVVDVELAGAREAARGGGEGGAAAGVAGRVHQRLGDAGVRHRARGRAVPRALGAAVGERGGQRLVDLAALGRAWRAW